MVADCCLHVPPLKFCGSSIPFRNDWRSGWWAGGSAQNFEIEMRSKKPAESFISIYGFTFKAKCRFFPLPSEPEISPQFCDIPVRMLSYQSVSIWLFALVGLANAQTTLVTTTASPSCNITGINSLVSPPVLWTAMLMSRLNRTCTTFEPQLPIR